MKYNPDIHHRRSIRLQNYDYSQAGMYFITICCQDKICRFGKIENGVMILNEYGKIVEIVWNKLPQHYANVQLDKFVVMPNHIHCIIAITNDNIVGAGLKPAPTIDSIATKQHSLSEIVRALKTFSARKINELRNTPGEKLWQRNYWEHIIRNEDSYLQIADYIMNNPANWENDKLYIE